MTTNQRPNKHNGTTNKKNQKKDTVISPSYKQHRAALQKQLDEYNEIEDKRIDEEIGPNETLIEEEREKVVEIYEGYEEKYEKDYLLQKIRDLANSLKPSASPGLIIKNTQPHLLELPDFVILHIFSFLDLFDDAILGSTNKKLREMYVAESLPKNSEIMGYFYVSRERYGSWELMAKVQDKMAHSGNYGALCHAIKFCLHSKCTIYPLINGLAQIPKENYLFTLASILPLVVEDVGLTQLAGYVVSGQPKPIIDRLFAHYMNDAMQYEFMALIVGELIIRNQYPPPNIKNAITQFYETKMVPNDHVLASISPRILYIENGLKVDINNLHSTELINYTKHKIPPTLFSQLFPAPRPLPEHHMHDCITKRWKKFDLDDITTFEDQKLAWGSYERCGVSELQIMQVNRSEPLISNDIFPVLLESNLNYLKEIKQPSQMNDLAFGLITPFAAFGMIFRSVANHRKDIFRVGSAYARVVTWKIIASLVGVPLSEGIDKIETEAKKCEFLLFQAPKTEDESWGVQSGIGVLRGDKKIVSCAVLETGYCVLKEVRA